MRTIQRRASLLALIALFAAALVLPGMTAARSNRTATLERWAADTWAGFVAMTNAATGLPSDNIGGDLDPATRSRYTSPTNIAMYIWATLAARDLQIITPGEARERIAVTLASIEAMERHEPSGQFWNWYDPDTLQKLTVWPEPPNNPVMPFASSVDNGWLASALLMIANGAVPRLRDPAAALLDSMNFGCYYDAGANLIRGGFWETPQGGSIPGDYCGMGQQVFYTGHHYGAFNTEPRIASYIGIAMGDIPARHYFGGWRTFPDHCDWSWPETRPIGVERTYTVDGQDITVFEGAYPYDDQLVVPTWGGSSFEAFMVPLVVPEEEWGPASWGVTHPLYAESMIEYGIDEAQYGYWGFSPASNPAGGYREYGIDYIGMNPDGYTSDSSPNNPPDVGLTRVDPGWDDPACPRPPDPIEDYGEGIVTPHAAAIALDFAPDAAFANLVNLEEDFEGLYGAGGFKDSVNVATGDIANRYLSLDQGMFMAAVANELRNDRLQHYFSHGEVEQALRPLMEMEQFGAGRMAP